MQGEVQAQKLSTVALSWGGNDRERLVLLQAADSIESCRVQFDSGLDSVSLFQARLGSTLYGQDRWVALHTIACQMIGPLGQSRGKNIFGIVIWHPILSMLTD